MTQGSGTGPVKSACAAHCNDCHVGFGALGVVSCWKLELNGNIYYSI